MIGMAANAQDAHRQVVREPVAGFSRREDGDLVPELSDAARDVDAIALQAPTGKQADNGERKMHATTSAVEGAEENPAQATRYRAAPIRRLPIRLVSRVVRVPPAPYNKRSGRIPPGRPDDHERFKANLDLSFSSMTPPRLNAPFQGRRLGMTIPRRMVADFMWISAKVPYVAAQRRMSLQELVVARRNHRSRPSWQAVFGKAFAIVAEDHRQLKRAYLSLPWPHLYEYAESVVSIATEREFLGDTGIFPVRIRDPAAIPLAYLSDLVRHYLKAPLEDMRFFRQLIWVTRCPLPVRRLVWWMIANLARQRKHFFGTFGLTSTSALGAEIEMPRAPLTTTLTYGILDRDGNIVVRMMYDHRVLDGATAARILVRLEQVLQGQVLSELRKS